MTRCKFTCTSKTITGSGENQTNSFVFSAVTSNGTDENKKFWKYTPSGQLKFDCLNKEVDFEIGKDYYLDISVVPTEAK
jgi:hypothetical protein